MSSLTNDEILRYSRHLIMPEVGMSGQAKLKDAKVLLVGAGGLGSPASMYLAAAGVGRLGLVDYDVVDVSNLQRQIVHGQSSVGVKKVESAKRRLLDLNPCIHIDTHETVLSSQNALELFREYDVIADGTDNFPTRYLVNDACVLSGKPNVYASIFRFEGQLSVFGVKGGPCYRCVYAEPPPPGLVPSCADGGVLGVLPGIVGAMQASEVIKLVLGLGEPLVGRLLTFDALSVRFRELKLPKEPNCAVCGVAPTVTKLIDYQQFCNMAANDHESCALVSSSDVAATELKQLLDAKRVRLIDVRGTHEWEICRIEGAQLIPLEDLPARMSELDTAEELVVCCKVGARSAKAINMLRAAGFVKVHNLRGGLMSWQRDVDRSMPRY